MARHWLHALVTAAVVGSLGGSWPEASAEDMPSRVRGTLSAVEGNTLAIATADGMTVSYPLKEGVGLFKVTPAELDQVKAGDFVGITSIGQGEQRVALEVHLFSEELRGTGEGHYAWDLVKEPNTMTNATVVQVGDAADGRTLEVEYGADEELGSPAGRQTVTVPEGVPVVRLEKTDDRSLLAPGKEVFVMVEAINHGSPVVVAAVIGDEGAAPPM